MYIKILKCVQFVGLHCNNLDILLCMYKEFTKIHNLYSNYDHMKLLFPVSQSTRKTTWERNICRELNIKETPAENWSSKMEMIKLQSGIKHSIGKCQKFLDKFASYESTLPATAHSSMEHDNLMLLHMLYVVRWTKREVTSPQHVGI